ECERCRGLPEAANSSRSVRSVASMVLSSRGQHPLDVEIFAVLSGDYPARQVEQQTFGNGRSTIGETRRGNCVADLLLSPKKLRRCLAVDQDVQKKPPAPFAVHAADTEQLRHNCTVIGRAVDLSVASAVVLEEPANDLRLEFEGFLGALFDLFRGRFPNRAGKLDGERINPTVRTD